MTRIRTTQITEMAATIYVTIWRVMIENPGVASAPGTRDTRPYTDMWSHLHLETDRLDSIKEHPESDQ